jgi:hypothetical protein
MSFGIPTDAPPEHWKLDVWRLAAQQAGSPIEITALEQDIIRRVQFAAKRGVSVPWAPEAMRLMTARRQQLAEAQAKASREGAGGDRGPTMKE